MKRTVVLCAALALILAAFPMAAQTGAWTAIGSSGAVDEASLGTYAVSLNSFGLQAGAVATVFARYNVTNTYGGGITDTPPWTTLEMTYFDTAPAGTVSATLVQVDRCTGIITTICNLSSVDALAPTCQTCTFPTGTVINFGTSHYVVEVRVSRTVNNVNPVLLGLRIF